MKDERICKNPDCKIAFSLKEVKFQYGKESPMYLEGFHSAGCYTKHVMKKKVQYIPINFLPVNEGFLPVATEAGYKDFLFQGASDRVLILCSDGVERFGRYLHGKISRWTVEGCAGQPEDFVTHFAYLKEPEF